MPNDESQSVEVERLADLLWIARQSRTALNAQTSPWTELTESAAGAIAEALYRRAGRSRSWKLGAIDPDTQRRFGISGPVCMPLLLGATEADVVDISLRRGDFIAPRFEAEIGIIIDRGIAFGVPCVEVADSRFERWHLPPFGMTADLGLQSKMFFGKRGEVKPETDVIVEHNGECVAVGSANWAQTLATLGLLPAGEIVEHVATGSITPPLECSSGVWCFDFGALGRITVLVE